jgi:hypothetical protein
VTTRTFKATAAALGAAIAIPAVATAANAQPTDPDLLAQVSTYLVEQIDADTELVPSPWGGADHGLSLDVLFALASTGADPGQVVATTAALADPNEIDGYLSFWDPDEKYAGATAKLSLGLLTGGLDPTDVAGRDLLAELTELVTESGRISDVSQYGDWSSVITQSLAVLAYTAAGEQLPENVVAFLVADQCDTGGFTNAFGDAPACTGDPDATAFAIQALAAADTAGEDVGAPLAAATAFLEDTQVDGVWLSDDLDGTPVANANSVGLASQAFSTLGLDTEEPRLFLASLQDPETCGLRYQLSDDEPDARATAQAVPALAEVGFLDLATGTHTPAALGDATCDGGTTDGDTTDGGTTDGGTTDGGTTDGDTTDSDTTDGGTTDGGTTDDDDTTDDDTTDDATTDDTTDGDTTDGDTTDDGTQVDEVDEDATDDGTEVADDGSGDTVTPTVAVAQRELPRTGAGPVPGLLGAAGAVLVAGAGLVAASRRRVQG